MWFRNSCDKFRRTKMSAKYYFASYSLVCLFTGLLILPAPALAVVENVTPFEWAMPDRLLVNTEIPGYDPADPIPQYDPNAEMLPADGWTVNFDACGVTTSTVASYEWVVDGVSVATIIDCQFSHQFPEEGSYQISLTVTDDVGDTAVIEETIVVQDWLIVAMGDSYGSGEGNPEIPVSAQAHVDFNILNDLVQNIRSDLNAALAQLPGLEDAEAAAQQAYNDAQTIRNQAAADLARVQQDLQDLLVINDNVENDPAVVAARNSVFSAQQWVSSAQIEVNIAQQEVDNCTPIINCPARRARLLAAQAELETAQASLVAAEAALWTARTAAVVIYSAIASIQNFDALSVAISTATLAVNAAQNTYTLAQNAFNNAAAALQDAIDAVASLQIIITDLQNAWNDALLNAQTQYLDHLPVWTSTAPSWGTPEPTYTEIVIGGAQPGEALNCHRSMISGQARAALALELADPHTSVTFVHLSCTGATIAKGIDGGYRGAEGNAVIDPIIDMIGSDNPMNYDPACAEEVTNDANEVIDIIYKPCILPTQLDAALQKTAGREIDAMVISIGGNDIKFARIIEECVLGQPCHEDLGIPPTSEFNDALNAAIEANCNPVNYFNQWTGLSLPTDWFPFSNACLDVYNFAETNIGDGDAAETFDTYVYGGIDVKEDNKVVESFQTIMQDLNQSIIRTFDGFDLSRVYITEYPDPTGDDMGVHCGWDPSQPPEGDGLRSLPGVTQPETIWAQVNVAATLREETRTAAQNNTWNFVTETGEGTDTIGTATRNHGYCADDHWTVRIPESLIIQQDVSGAMHPNRAGHEVYKKAIFNSLMADLYPAGINQPPRIPVEPPIANTPRSGGGGGSSGGSIGWVTLLVLTLLLVFRRRILPE